MLQAKKLTYKQKRILADNMLNPADWLYVKETEFYIKVRNKDTGIEKMVSKFPRKYRS